ncbi:MAG: acetamidase/formamidase family protein [Gaiellaceae bacterium]
MLHELALERQNLHGHFSRDLAPALAIEPGDSVRISVPNSGWRLDSGERFSPLDEKLDAGHALAGPIEVRGARAGQMLSVSIDEVRPGPWGVTFGNEHEVRWKLSGDVARSGRFAVAMAPFLGVLGMPPPDGDFYTTIPPRRWGGNVDCKELVAGTTLFLPIPVDGARFSAGDPHAAQGDGEVSRTAIECPAQATLTLDVQDEPLEWPRARTSDAWLTFGFDVDLDVAARIATEEMLGVMQELHGVTHDEALALASVVVDLRVTQVVNEVVGVHAVLRDGALR